MVFARGVEDVVMDEEGSPPSAPGPRRFPPFSPEERLPDEIDQLLALRQTWAKTNVANIAP